MTHTVTLNQLCIERDQQTIVKELSLHIADGEFVVLLGPSGCGKSTLLNAVAGLLNVSSGQVLINGVDVTHAEPKDRDIAMVFQSYALYPTMSVYDNLAFALKVAGLKRAAIAQRIASVAKTLQLEAFMNRKPHQLSGGQKQRVAIGRALVREKGVLLFDEPLSNLDAKLRTELRMEILRLHKAFNNTVIYVTHDQVEAMTLADRIAVMHQGRIEQIGTPLEVYRHPNSAFVARFVGTPSINLVPGTLHQEGEAWFFRHQDIRLTLAHYRPKSPLRDSQPVQLGIRPEAIKLQPGTRYQVDIIERTGADCIVWCKDDRHSWIVKTSHCSSLESGHRVDLSFDDSNLSLFDPTTGMRL